MAARLGVVTGQGLSDLIRDRFGVRWTVFAMLVLLVANVANTVAEFAGRRGGARDLRHLALHRGARRRRRRSGRSSCSRQLSHRRAGLPVGRARLRHLHRVGRPGPPRLGRRSAAALVTPDAQRLGARAILLLMVALVGTTITPYMQFYLQSAVAEKGIGEEELRLEQADAIGGAVWTNVIAVFIVIATAVTIFAVGRHDQRRPRRGAGARAGRRRRSPSSCSRSACSGRRVLAATIMPITTAFVICEAFGWESGVGKRFRDAPGVLRDLHVRAVRSARSSCCSRAST